jgi:hypothetical protein
LNDVPSLHNGKKENHAKVNSPHANRDLNSNLSCSDNELEQIINDPFLSFETLKSVGLLLYST